MEGVKTSECSVHFKKSDFIFSVIHEYKFSGWQENKFAL